MLSLDTTPERQLAEEKMVLEAVLLLQGIWTGRKSPEGNEVGRWKVACGNGCLAQLLLADGDSVGISRSRVTDGWFWVGFVGKEQVDTIHMQTRELLIWLAPECDAQRWAVALTRPLVLRSTYCG